MVHEALPGLVNALGNNVKVSTVWETKDHYLKDYVPYIQVSVKGRLNPEHWRIIQAQKGMIVLDVRCGLCDCIDTTGKGDELAKTEHGFITLALTPILDAYESSRMNDWVEEIQAHYQRATSTKP
jgi:hypothetical protein